MNFCGALVILVAQFFVALPIAKANIECALKTGVDQAYNKVGDAALKGIKFHDGRTKGNMNLFECTCSDDDVSIFDSLKNHSTNKEK